MSKWIDFTIDERKAMIQAVSDEKQIDEASAEKDWWVTAVLYVIFHTCIGEYLLFKGGTSLSKGWNIINRFSEDIDLALSRDFFLNVKNLACANCTSNTQIHHLREKAFLLCEEYQKAEPRTHRMTRHFYDLEKLMQTPYAEVALNDVALYEDIVNHRRKFYHVGYVDYDKELPQSIQIVPSDALLPSYEADYNEMRGSFIYGESLDFSALMKRMAELQERFRKISNEL